MAIPRSSLSPIDGFDESIDWGAFNARIGERVLRVLTGGSLLAFHMAVFGSALFASLLWGLIQHPTDLATLEGFRVWGVIVALHALLTGTWQLAARLFGWNEPEYVTTAAPVRRAQSVESRPTVPARVWSSGVEGASRVNSTARRWAASTRKVSTPQDSAIPGDWPQQPVILANDEREDVGEVTWPASIPRSTALNAAPGESGDELLSIDPAATGSAADGAQTWVDSFVESRTKPKEQRWSWVEAAAASWLSRRPGEPGTDTTPAEDIVVASADDPHRADDGEPASGA